MGVQSKEVVPPWGLAVAGATGAVLANALVYPLDMYEALTIERTSGANTLVESRRVCKSKSRESLMMSQLLPTTDTMRVACMQSSVSSKMRVWRGSTLACSDHFSESQAPTSLTFTGTRLSEHCTYHDSPFPRLHQPPSSSAWVQPLEHLHSSSPSPLQSSRRDNKHNLRETRRAC